MKQIKCRNRRHTTTRSKNRKGYSRLDVAVVSGILLALLGILVPSIQYSRMAARKTRCQSNMKRIGQGLAAYHDLYSSLPVAAVWNVNRTHSASLRSSDRSDRFIEANWAILLLPLIGQTQLAQSFDTSTPVASRSNTGLRMQSCEAYICAADEFNQPDNPFVFQATDSLEIKYARGNYAINGGSHSLFYGAGSTSAASGDLHVLQFSDDETRFFTRFGSGVAGFNKSFSFDDFRNGLSTLVAVEEVRAGIHSTDPRGVWALGDIASSITWAHGVAGDAYGPNCQFPRSDDIFGCATLHDTLGTGTLLDLEMPCVSYVNRNNQAAARSRHRGGINALFADGHVRFIKDEIDPGIWTVIHSRDTPSSVLAENFDELLTIEDYPDTPGRALQTVSKNDFFEVKNSLEMTFVRLPAGEFIMGVPDKHNSKSLPPECPQHLVRITQPILFGVCEVTQKQYRAVMGKNPSWHGSGEFLKEIHEDSHSEINTGQLPVERVSWLDANEFCRRLGELPEEKAAGRLYRLPTEAEWEYACRGGKSVPFNWSARRSSPDDSGAAAGVRPALPVAAVGSYQPNNFGLFDMRGNVWEWCSDWFDRDYYSRSPVVDPQGPAGGFIKVVRGGDWTFTGETCRINYPMTPPWKSSRFIGFRVVCEISPERTRQERSNRGQKE